MFPSYQSGDFLHEISDIPHHQDFPQQNLTPGEASAAEGSQLTLTTHRMGKGKLLKKLAAPNSIDGINAAADNDDDTRKIMRKEIERQRRQQMAKLYAELRSMLPLESIKGKRAVSDHTNEAVNYIINLKKKIQELGVKRDKLKRLGNSSDSYSSLINCVAVNPYWGGVEIVVNSSFREGSCWHLSSLMQVVLEEGLDVVRCVSSQTNEGVFHAIQSEVSYPTQLDLTRLQRKLNDLILCSD